MRRWNATSWALAGAMVTATVLVFAPTRPAVATSETQPTPPLKVGFVSLLEFQKNSKRWQSQSSGMSARRMEATKKLVAHQDEIRTLQNKLTLTTDTNQRADLEVAIKDKQQELEARTKKMQQELERDSIAVLNGFKETFDREVKALAKERGLHAIIAYPAMDGHGMTALEAKSPQAMDMYFRATAMMPLYLDDALDLTREMTKRFDADFEPATQDEK